MRVRLFAGMLGALALAACASPIPRPSAPADTPVAATPTQTVTVAGTKALIVAELAYNSAATAVKTAVEVGLVKPGSPLAQRLRALNSTASGSLEVARTTRVAAERAAAIERALSAVADLGTLTPKGG